MRCTGHDVLIGRHPTCTVRFDPETELAVSARHAVIEQRYDIWWLRDLSSTNGTWLNGQRISTPAKLSSGDRILFGEGGPLAEWRRQSTSRESTTKRIRAQVARHIRQVRLVFLALAVLVVAGATVLLQQRRRAESQWLRERSALQQQIDSLLQSGQAAVSSLRGEVRGLSDALRESESRVRDVSADLSDAQQRLSSDQTQQLHRELQAAREGMRRQQLAASLDFRAIERLNRRAIAQVFAESQAGVVSSATAFSVRADGLLVTSRHVVSDSAAVSRPRRLAVQFADSDQFWNAVVVSVSNESDIALIRVLDIVGDVPVVHALSRNADQAAAGSPVAIIGFPMGGAVAVPAPRSIARPLLSAAIVRAVRPGRLEIEGYGAAGASGSPIIDRNGEIVGLLYGGYRDASTGESIILAVPISFVRDLLISAR